MNEEPILNLAQMIAEYQERMNIPATDPNYLNNRIFTQALSAEMIDKQINSGDPRMREIGKNSIAIFQQESISGNSHATEVLTALQGLGHNVSLFKVDEPVVKDKPVTISKKNTAIKKRRKWWPW